MDAADLFRQAAEIIAAGKKVVAFSGAGMSAESGIPTFRDPGGIWDQFDPEEFGTTEGILAVFQKRPEAIRQFFLNTIAEFESSKPNAGHFAVAELERMGILNLVITQTL